ncbi:Hypothetical protein CINCED_3A007661 [Cinara cedri]|uniref:Uncharacterized protein n=1 Tax=Cinara cedri TaxID=506608 RepID=A0A5E4MGN5_9HEMI|nr:Hypothetical protein CINCED_3A007661 [Cinara cedri]
MDSSNQIAGSTFSVCELIRKFESIEQTTSQQLTNDANDLGMRSRGNDSSSGIGRKSGGNRMQPAKAMHGRRQIVPKTMVDLALDDFSFVCPCCNQCYRCPYAKNEPKGITISLRQ